MYARLSRKFIPSARILNRKYEIYKARSILITFRRDRELDEGKSTLPYEMRGQDRLHPSILTERHRGISARDRTFAERFDFGDDNWKLCVRVIP